MARLGRDIREVFKGQSDEESEKNCEKVSFLKGGWVEAIKNDDCGGFEKNVLKKALEFDFKSFTNSKSSIDSFRFF